MPIPESRRVIYKNSALERVVCQVRFPSILKIGAGTPVEFQDAIREKYPYFEERPSEPDLPDEVAALINSMGAPKIVSGSRAFDFASPDKEWTVALTRDFLALSTSGYTRWEVFREKLRIPVDTLREIYRPSFCTRIGLRYTNTIIRSKLGLKDVPWSELLKPHIAGELAEPNIIGDIQSAKRQFLMALEGGVGQVQVSHYLSSVKDTDPEEQCFTIDADYFTTKETDTNDAISTLDDLNGFAGRLFRWCITQRLHQAMEPEPA